MTGKRFDGYVACAMSCNIFKVYRNLAYPDMKDCGSGRCCTMRHIDVLPVFKNQTMVQVMRADSLELPSSVDRNTIWNIWNIHEYSFKPKP